MTILRAESLVHVAEIVAFPLIARTTKAMA